MRNSALSLGLALEMRLSMVVVKISIVSMEVPRRRMVLTWVLCESMVVVCSLVA